MGSQDTVGVWKEKKFPSIRTAPVTDRKENKFLDIIPITIEKEEFESWIKAPSLISGGTVSLPHLAFNGSELSVAKKHNFHLVDVLSRKAMLHNLVSDKFLETILTFVSDIITDWESLDMTKLGPKMKALQQSVHLAYISNQNARQFILGVYVNNKLRFRSFVLDLAVGCKEIQ